MMTSASVTCNSQGIIVAGDLKLDNIMSVHNQGLILIADCVLKKQEAIDVCLSKVVNCDSSALSLLLSWFREAKKRGIHITFSSMPLSMLNIARLSGLETVLPLV